MWDILGWDAIDYQINLLIFISDSLFSYSIKIFQKYLINY